MTSGTEFHRSPILNSPYEVPKRHWKLDENRQPTETINESRREVSFITPIPRPRGSGGRISLDERTKALGNDDQQYELGALIDSLRQEVAEWRALPEGQWNVTSETARLLKHWRHHRFSGIRPFFCQTEAVETAIWLTEVAPRFRTRGKRFLDHMKETSKHANPGLERLALKLATGAGKTAVMAMLIAWQTVNATRHPNSTRFTRGFLVVTPGITVRDRLRVLHPNDPDSYYASRELVPTDMLRDLDRAVIVTTNFHAFQRRETLELAKVSRAFLQGYGSTLETREAEGEMLARVCPELLSMKGVLVLNDEAHHCYREKPGEDAEGQLAGDDLSEAKQNREDARIWISGLEAVKRKIGLKRVIDLSATPFFLRGSGYAEGTLFPWTVSDFSLMDAIECGIVKLPRVPVVDNVAAGDMPMFRNLWEHIGKQMPKSGGRGKRDPSDLPTELKTALEALYAHYEQTFNQWQRASTPVPPCFIVVCNNTASSKLVYDYIAGYRFDKGGPFVPGRLSLFHNFDDDGAPLPRRRTLLIDSQQLDSDDALAEGFRSVAAEEIARFRRERIQRTGDHIEADRIPDKELLREVLNTVGKPDTLGESIRCVVSVSMLSEGWDAKNVTHILGLRAFGTQLLCEQVIGRSLRRQSYELNEDGLFNAEYADVFGIPFDFTAEPVVAPPQSPSPTVQVKALSPERDRAEIRFPRVAGYRTALDDDRLEANFTEGSRLTLTPAMVGATITHNQGIVGEGHDLTIESLDNVRTNTVVYELAKELVINHWRDGHDEPKMYLFGQLRRIAQEWIESCLVCEDGTKAAQLLYVELTNEACRRITDAIVRKQLAHGEPVKALLDTYNPVGTTRDVNFTTAKERYATTSCCHVNYAILDSTWEGELCRILDSHPRVLAWVKNHGLGFEVPYKFEGAARRYIPDFIAHIDDGRGSEDPLRLVVEVKGYRGEDSKAKKHAMETYWISGVNALSDHGRWDFLELTERDGMEANFDDYVNSKCHTARILGNRNEEVEIGQEA